ncbi:MAG TPA: DNA translocase FtsK, partial [Bacteroidetes bacterium]|nr:DNA translocase FtsK [Bacteroidota bacterium]
MARKANSVKGKSGAKKKPAAKKKGERKVAQVTAQFAMVRNFLRSPEGRKVFALLLILSSAFMIIAFVSHFFTGYQDQSMLEAGGQAAKNWLGSLGAWVSQLFVSRGFGFMAILIPVYAGLWGFALLEKKYYRILGRMFKYVLFAVLWGSVFFAFLSFIIWKGPSLMGGGYGWYLTDSLFGIIGRIGVGLLVFVALLIFLVLNFNLEFPFSKVVNKLNKDDAETKDETETEEVPAGEEGLNAGTSEVENENEGEKQGENEIMVSVRSAKDEQKDSEVKDETLGEKPKKNEPKDIEVEDGTVALEIKDQAKKEKPKVLRPGMDMEMEISLPGPDEIPEIIAAPDLAASAVAEAAGLKMAVEDTRDPANDVSLEGDNIQEVDADKFEKIIPEEDQESLHEGEDLGDWEDYDPTLELSSYQYPTIDLLEHRDGSNSREVNRAELEENKNKIITTLQNYKIDIISIKATIGPTVTLYEIVPAPGVRISKIRNLEDDIALSLSAMGIRIIAPIPGKGTIGIEIPNSKPEIVSMRSVMATEKFRDTKAELPLVLGRTISNEVYIADLAKMPHLLIAGATGQGKSVGINGIISSILYKKHPAQVKFVLIDPKKVELSLYGNLE